MQTKNKNPRKHHQEPRYRVTYRNGAGYRTLYAHDYTITQSGHLSFRDTDGRGHVMGAGAEWRVREVQADV